jgi:hypothetical protein
MSDALGVIVHRVIAGWWAIVIVVVYLLFENGMQGGE